jgi:hypothetical protein
MATIPVFIVPVPEPQHCDRPMLPVENRSRNELPYSSPIWWCRECGYRMLRQEEAAS